MQRFGDHLAKLCANAAMSHATLAKIACVNRSTVSRLINGKRKLTADVAKKLAYALKVTPHTLVGGTDAAYLLAPDKELAAPPSPDLMKALGELQQTKQQLAELEMKHAEIKAQLAVAMSRLTAFTQLTARFAKLAPELRALASISENL
jgi:transcriptional regulator with XRE-family HTH domain